MPDLIGGSYPSAYNEIVLVVDGNNVVSPEALAQFGVDVYQRDASGKILYDTEKDKPIYKRSMSFAELFAAELKLVDNDTYYEFVDDGKGGYYQPRTYNGKDAEYTADEELWNAPSNVDLKIVGVLRLKDGGSGFVGNALCYTPELAERVLTSAATSDVTLAQKALLEQTPSSKKCVISNDGYFSGNIGEDSEIISGDILGIAGFFISGLERTAKLKALAVEAEPVYINIYPKDFESKSNITAYLNDW